MLNHLAADGLIEAHFLVEGQRRIQQKMVAFFGRWSAYFGLIRDGFLVTVELTVLGCILALIVAFVAGLSRMSRHTALRWLATVYIEFFRGTSIFVQLFWAYFVLPLFGLPLSSLQAGVLALGLNVGAYGAEVVRGAIQAVPRAQREASTALNLTRYQTHALYPVAAGDRAYAADLRQ